MRHDVTSGCLVATLLLSVAADAKDFYVSPTGSPSGNGSISQPWDLATGLSDPSVAPGDTVWLQGGDYVGSYSGDLTGTESQPIVVRSAPGQWARVDGKGSNERTFEFHGAWTIYRDFEITNTDADRWGERPFVDAYGPNLKLVNLVIHDTGGMGFWTPSKNSEIYGCIIYNNGYDLSDRGHGHGLYMQNDQGTKRVFDNILFGGYSFGVHAYTEGGSIQGFDIVGNVWFNAGVNSSVSGHKDDCLVGGLQPADRISLRENFAWAIGGSTRTVALGYSVPNVQVALQDNYFIGALDFATPWSDITITGNTLCTVSGVNTSDYPANTYLTATPTVTQVFVRPNQYEPGRAHIIVYNWDQAPSQNVDLSEVLSPGDGYEIRNAQNFFASPVATGVYDGSPVSVAQTGLTPVQPIGSPGSYDVEDQTGDLFNVFVVLKTTVACSFQAECDDADPCTTDTCEQGVCVHGAIAGCCQSAAQCDDSNACTSDSCAGTMCAHDAIAGCCDSDVDCSDNNACTADTCEVSTGLCGNEPAAGGCAVDADCSNPDPCVRGKCSSGCTCEFEPVEGCETDAGAGGDGGDGGSDGRDAGTGPAANSDEDSGCGCSVPAGRGAPSWLLFLAVVVLGRLYEPKRSVRRIPIDRRKVGHADP